MDKNIDLDNKFKSINYHDLKSLTVRLITQNEQELWDQLMSKHHYLGFRKLVGESLKYVALLNGKWVALLGWGTAAFKCHPRDNWIGWTREQQWQRLKFITNNQRFLVLPDYRIKNLASKTLSLNLKRLSNDWQHAYNHPILLAETFVDPNLFLGTCYRANGWLALGQTLGYGRKAGHYYHHGHSKTIFVYPLRRNTQQLLSDPFLDPELTGKERAVINMNSINIENNGGLLEYLSKLKDPRKPRGIRHDQISILAVAICAIISGSKTFASIGEWAADLPQSLLKRLRCRWHDDKEQYIPPSEPTLRRTIQSVDANEVDKVLGDWICSQCVGNVIAIDGKVLRGSADSDGKKVHLVSAFLHKEKVVIAQEAVDKKSNEITAFQPLLKDLDIKGMVITADAMQTQVKNATFVVEEKGADYIFPVKNNQGNLNKDILDLDDEDFSP